MGQCLLCPSQRLFHRLPLCLHKLQCSGGFGGVGGQTHGQHNRARKPGSLGASSYPSRVFKGKRLPGQMGGEQVKVLNLRVLKVIPESNLILVKGSIPGAKGAYLTIEK